MRGALLAVFLILPTIAFALSPGGNAGSPAGLASPSSSIAGFPEGVVKVGHIEVKLDHDVIYAIISTDLVRPVLKTDVAIWDTTYGYSDGLGNATFRIPVYINDNTDAYDMLVKLYAEVEGYGDWNRGGEDYKWVFTEDTDFVFFYWDFATDVLDSTEGAVRYRVFAKADITVFRPFKADYEWYDHDGSNSVRVESRAHPPYEQTVEINIPADSSQFEIGSNTGNVVGYVEAGDDPPPGFGMAHMAIITNAKTPDQDSDFRTGANGGFWETFRLDDPTAAGEVTIRVYDDPCSAEYLASSDGDSVTIFATRKSGWSTFGLFAVPGHRTALGVPTEYLVAIPSYEGYEDSVTLNVLDLPPGVLYSFEANRVRVPPDSTLGVNLTLEAGAITPLGFHEIRITASDDTLTREFVCPLFVEDPLPPAPILDLQVIAQEDTSVTLCWTAPGADADSGWAYEYDIRYSTVLPDGDTASWWADADTIAQRVMAGPPGWRDTCVVNGLALPDSIYYFAVKTADGALIWSEISNIVEVPDAGVREPAAPGLPAVFALSPNRPNPFTRSTEIRYALPRDCHVRLEIYDIRGRQVASLIDEEQQAGYKRAIWDASSVSPGIFFCRFMAGEFTSVEKMVVLR